MKRTLAFAAALALVVAFSVRPAEANHQLPPVVVDRTAFTLIYGPVGAGTSVFAGGVSWRFDRTWDLLASYSSFAGGFTAFRFGGRYHLRPPSPATDVSLNIQYFSEAGGAPRTGFLVGAGIVQELAPTLTSYYNAYYDTQASIIRGDLGVQYELSKQLSLVTGFEVNSGVSYLGLSYKIGVR